MNNSSKTNLRQPIEWAMETDLDPFFMLANWLVRDAIDDAEDAVSTITSSSTSLSNFRTMKRLFKHLRVEGETPADRRLGAHLYAATIAGALVHHDRLITVQSKERLGRAFSEIEAADDLPDSLAELAHTARVKLENHEDDRN